jgi:hypothetical protein
MNETPRHQYVRVCRTARISAGFGGGRLGDGFQLGQLDSAAKLDFVEHVGQSGVEPHPDQPGKIIEALARQGAVQKRVAHLFQPIEQVLSMALSARSRLGRIRHFLNGKQGLERLHRSSAGDALGARAVTELCGE